jgi:hypothetical protein
MSDPEKEGRTVEIRSQSERKFHASGEERRWRERGLSLPGFPVSEKGTEEESDGMV